ncbi:COG2963 Transposase and inactivated derivatives [uncultured Caudovirales phage]|uniref:COG2963 Transposase and inactivated derivatives n=1 Tax=uncultured Caudovirales phage TaxID=2100421 RepID=A0A6J5R750_9CAUD|nr:COG2963 Transposase and inactivated derivatives [uncultured Caudovirales phage]
MSTRRKFTSEFKQQAVDLVEAGEVQKAQIARDLGIAQSLLRKWCKDGVPSPRVIRAPAREPEPVQETKINCEHHAKRVSASELQMVEKLDRALCENRALKAVVKALLDSERVTV